MADQESEPVQIGRYRLRRELVERQHLSRAGYKIPNQLAYPQAWVARVEDSGQWRAVRYFETEEEAREWAEGEGA